MGPRLVAALTGAVVLLAGAVLVLGLVVLRSSPSGAGAPAPGVGTSTTPTPTTPTPTSAAGPSESPTAPPTDSPTVKVFDADALSVTIEQQYRDKFGDTAVQVRCPAGEPVTVGRVFYCTIVGRTEQVQVTVQTADGDYTWRPVGS
jgi:hypothetical protein